MFGLHTVHLFVCMMIELRNYALNDKTLLIFDICKLRLSELKNSHPELKNVIDMYISVQTPYDMPLALCKTQYTDRYVDEINQIIVNIMSDESDIKLKMDSL